MSSSSFNFPSASVQAKQLIDNCKVVAMAVANQSPEVQTASIGACVQGSSIGALALIVQSDPKAMEELRALVVGIISPIIYDEVAKKISMDASRAETESVSSSLSKDLSAMNSLRKAITVDDGSWGSETDINDARSTLDQRSINNQPPRNEALDSFAARTRPTTAQHRATTSQHRANYKQHFPKHSSTKKTSVLPNGREMPEPTHDELKLTPWDGGKSDNPKASITDSAGFFDLKFIRAPGMKSFLQHSTDSGMPIGWCAEDDDGAVTNKYGHTVRSNHFEAWKTDDMSHWLTPQQNSDHRHRVNGGVWEHQVKDANGRWPTTTTPYREFYKWAWHMRPQESR